MDIFSLVGRITVNYADAVRNIDQVSDAADDAADNLGDMADAADDADRPIRNTGDAASDADGKFTVWKATLSNLAATVIQNLVSKCGELAVGVLEASANAQAMNSQFTQVFGDMESQASSDLSAIADSAGMMENRMKGSYTQIAAFAKTTGMDTSDALDLANRSMVAVADSAAFYDRSLEDTTESLQSFLKGNYENDAALGLSCTETTRNAAANELYGKSFNDLSEAQKQLTLLKMVEDANAASGALGQAARESDTWTNQTGNLQQAWTDFQAVLGDNVLPLAVDIVKGMATAIQTVTNNMPAIIQKFNELLPVITGVTTAVTTFVIALNFSTIVQTVSTALASLKTAVLAVNAAVAANPIILVVTLIAGLIAAIITLWNTNEDFRNGVIAIWEAVKSAFSTAIDAIVGFFTGLWENIVSIWESIKTAFSTAWEAIKNIIQVALMFIVELITGYFNLITLPWRFIWENCKEYIIAAWNAIKNTITTVLNAIKTVISTVMNAIKSAITTVMNAIKTVFSTVWNAIKSVVTTVINAIKSVITSVFNAVRSTVTSILNSIKSTFSSVWNGIKSTVSNVINGIKSTISNGLNAAKSTVTNVLNSIKNAFSNILNGAKNIVSNAINAIKSKFNFSWSLPKLKLPHVKISGSFSLTPPSVPHFSIDWYKKAMDEGMIMNQPTIFGYNAKSNQFMAGGEAGSETVVGTESLMQMVENATIKGNDTVISVIDAWFRQLYAIFEEFFPQFANMQLVTDTGALVGEIAPAIDDELGQIYRRKGR